MNSIRRSRFPYHNDDVRDMLIATNKWIGGERETIYRIHVVTGDRTGAGTDANVFMILSDIYGNQSPIIRPKTFFFNDHERASTTTVEIGDTQLGISPPFASVQVWRDNFGNVSSAVLGKVTEYLFGGDNNQGGSAAWFLDRIEIEAVEKQHSGQTFKKNIQLFHKTNKKLGLDKLDSHSRSSSESSLCDAPPKHIFPVRRWIEADKVYHVELYDSVIPQLDPRPSWRREELRRKKFNYRFRQNIEDGPMQVRIMGRKNGEKLNYRSVHL